MGLRVLAVDDEAPALDDLVHLLGAHPRIAEIHTARDGASALRKLDRALAEGRPFTAVFLDIRMPGLDGTVLGRLLAQFARAPRIVFVTAYEDHAVDAFEIKATDYILKPVRPERLNEAIRRVIEAVDEPEEDEAGPAEPEPMPVELGGVTRFVSPSEVLYVEAQGDYARLHTSGGSHLVRIPLAALSERWTGAGFVRVHRSHLVSLSAIKELRLDSGRCTVLVGETELPVSRRHVRELRDLLVRRARRSH
ncbi:LytTR family two component transcriptional regulator [Actinomadura hallensis]|uniref:LytTR family two component transcriptional regulator n=1 Tax=Actinomadura hallensis TaxID=337895 RepID=A0A543I8T3_9ACTN|nr:LytTR family DNA-binding domain-containing protein [Actinomadura hallensis]TQM66900.1 LytTR family two component transcriptional regulator [Actinomadura hallensis]HLV71276.1 LytTR family DNA-binding domain-containing protein [Vulgatibacteraceae bacterium]